VKDPTLPDTLSVTELVAPNTVNTMPEKTMNAVAEHGETRGDTMSGTHPAAQEIFDSLTDVFRTVENEGIDKFEASWAELAGTVNGQLTAATT